MIAYSGPFWPLFLHLLGAMTLFGTFLAAAAALATGHRRAGFRALLVAVPAWVLMRAGAQWTYSKGYSAVQNQTWLSLGFAIADAGLVVLLLALGAAYWSQRSPKDLARRIAAALCGVYLVLLAVAWLAMTGKWR